MDLPSAEIRSALQKLVNERLKALAEAMEIIGRKGVMISVMPAS